MSFRKIQLYVFIFSLVGVSVVFLIIFNPFGRNEEKQYSELRIDQIERVSICLDEKKIRLKNIEREKYSYNLTEEEVAEFLGRISEMEIHFNNHPSMDDGYFFLLLELKEYNDPDIVFVYFDESEQKVILKMPNGNHSSKEYNFFYDLFEKAKISIGEN